jgi:hypothetical protein
MRGYADDPLPVGRRWQRQPVPAFVDRMTRAGWAHASPHHRDTASPENTRIAGSSTTTFRHAQSIRPFSSSHQAVVAGRRDGLSCCLRIRLGRCRPIDVGLPPRAVRPVCVHRILWCPVSARGHIRLGSASFSPHPGWQGSRQSATAIPFAAGKNCAALTCGGDPDSRPPWPPCGRRRKSALGVTVKPARRGDAAQG